MDVRVTILITRNISVPTPQMMVRATPILFMEDVKIVSISHGMLRSADHFILLYLLINTVHSAYYKSHCCCDNTSVKSTQAGDFTPRAFFNTLNQVPATKKEILVK